MKMIRWNNDPIFSELMNSFFDRDPENKLFRRSGCAVPPTNITETEEAFELELAVPGMPKDQFSIEVENNVLTISSVKKEENEENGRNYARREFLAGCFTRSFMLPKSVDTEKIKAEYTDGILKVSLPKREEEKTKVKREIRIS